MQTICLTVYVILYCIVGYEVKTITLLLHTVSKKYNVCDTQTNISIGLTGNGNQSQFFI